jgi:hypothetical protein
MTYSLYRNIVAGVVDVVGGGVGGGDEFKVVGDGGCKLVWRVICDDKVIFKNTWLTNYILYFMSFAF